MDGCSAGDCLGVALRLGADGHGAELTVSSSCRILNFCREVISIMDSLRESFENYLQSLKTEEKETKQLIIPAWPAHYGGPGPSAESRLKDSVVHLERPTRETIYLLESFYDFAVFTSAESSATFAVVNPEGSPLRAPGSKQHEAFANMTLSEVDEIRRQYFYQR